MADRPSTPRARARADMIEQIKDAARERLAVDGADVSLRAVARDLGVVSSAVYRYFASRDDLLTALIVDGYDAMGATVEAAEASVARANLSGRWSAFCHASRAWARAHPDVYALLYGSPLPGYAAPQDTVGPATRTLLIPMAILRDGASRGVIETPHDRLPKGFRADLRVITEQPGFESIPVTLLARGFTVWATLFGVLSFEVFGRYNDAFTDLDGQFEVQVRAMAAHLGLP